MAKPAKSAAPAEAMQLSEALRLSLIEGLSIRAIARRLQMTRKTVRKLLGRAPARPSATKELPRGSLLDTYDAAIRKLGLIHSRGHITRGGYNGEDGNEGTARDACAPAIHG